MKTIFKWIWAVSLSIFIVSGNFAVHEWKSHKPFFFRVFLDRSLIKATLYDPELQTSIEVLESLAIYGLIYSLKDGILADLGVSEYDSE